MIEIDETALIEFFGVLPETQSEDEREFFAVPLFKKRVGEHKILFSVSAHFRDLRITLERDTWPKPIIELVVPNIIRVEPERRSSTYWLRIISETHGETEISVDPTIAIRSISA